MGRYDFQIYGVVRASNMANAKMFLQELLSDETATTQMPMRPIEFFEVIVKPVEE